MSSQTNVSYLRVVTAVVGWVFLHFAVGCSEEARLISDEQGSEVEATADYQLGGATETPRPKAPTPTPSASPGVCMNEPTCCECSPSPSPLPSASMGNETGDTGQQPITLVARSRGGLVDDVIDWLDDAGGAVLRWFRGCGDDIAESAIDAAKNGIRGWDRFPEIEVLIKSDIVYDRRGNVELADRLLVAAQNLQDKIREISRHSPQTALDKAMIKLLKNLLEKIYCKASKLGKVNGSSTIGNKIDQIDDILQTNR